MSEQSPSISEVEVDRLAKHKVVLWRLDIQAIVAAVLLGAAATALLQIAERIDTAISGGLFVLLGILVLSSTGLITGYLYGLPAAIIAVSINPFISTMTATNPMSWFFFVNNWLYIIPSVLAMYYLQPMDKWWKWAVASLIGAIPAFVSFVPVQINVFGIPLTTALMIMAVHTVWEFIGPPTVARWVSRAALRSGVAK